MALYARILRTILLYSFVISTLAYQEVEEITPKIFKLRTKLLREIKSRRKLPPPYLPNPINYHSLNPSLAQHVLRHRVDPLPHFSSESTNVVHKRMVSSPVLQNRKVQNFIRQKLKDGAVSPKPYYNATQTKRNANFESYNSSSQRDNFLSVPNLQVTRASRINETSVYSQRNKLSKDTSKSKNEKEESKISFLGYVISTLTQLPVIGNVLRASVDPLYRPIVNQLQPDNETIMRGETNIANWCFGVLGCIEPTRDFFHPLYRPVNLPPYPREKIATTFKVHSRNNTKGYPVPAMEIEEISYSTYASSKPTKILIHGYLNNGRDTWMLEMIRGLLNHGDYNVITVDWSGGSYALYSQATANIRVVALEIARLLNWLKKNMNLDVSKVHIIGHSLGSHTAGYVGEKVRGLGRITGLDPAEPFFQYMPNSVRLDPSDAEFVDVIHTDIDSFFALTGPRGFGLQQPVGHVDFYPNGGKEQPGCNQLLARVPMTMMMEGDGIIEGINAAQTELMSCDHVRSAKLFTDSLSSKCPYLGFRCPSYQDYKKGKCFSCGESGEGCAFMGMNADLWTHRNETNVRMFLDTHYAPNFCKYHYILTINFADPTSSQGTLRGRLEISFINDDGNLKKFDLTALSPLKFPRRGSRAFMLEHFEDLTKVQEALVTWTYESDLLDPLSFCVLFCNADLSISTVSLMSVDTLGASAKALKMHSGLIKGRKKELLYGREILMCHKKGEPIIKIPSESTVKISASPYCIATRNIQEETKPSIASKVQKVE